MAQTGKPATSIPGGQGRTKTKTTKSKVQTPKKKLSPQKQFVLDVVQSAVALPQADPQDRLRVLTAAVNVVGPVNSALAKRYAREGAKIEADLIAHGEKPNVSILSAGHVDCAIVPEFVDQIPATAVPTAEQSLINLMSACPKEGREPVRRKLEAALSQNLVAPRALMAMMEATGPKTSWSQNTFEEMFKSLPSDPEENRSEAPNYAAMFNQMAPQVDKEVARTAGLHFLEWLGKLKEGGERNLAVNMTVDTLKQVLGEEAYQDALASNVVARDVANTAGQPGEIVHPEEENVSVLGAMAQGNKDQTEQLSKLPVTMRAREAAAHGFAAGTSGHPKAADRYFDMAFSALDEVWGQRNDIPAAPDIVQEVSEAAAQVNPVSALTRAQALSDPSEQAISMLAVARVVMGQSLEPSSPPSGRGVAVQPIK